MYDRGEVSFDVAFACMRRLGQIFSPTNDSYVAYRINFNRLEYSVMPDGARARVWKPCAYINSPDMLGSWLEVKE